MIKLKIAAFRGLIILAAMVFAFAGVSSSQATDEVNFALNWVPGPQHMEFVVAKHGGFFEREGLDVSMHAPAGATDPIKLVASGQDDFGISYAGDLIQAYAQGVPIISLAAIHRSITLGLFSAPETNIKTPKDLEGKLIGLTPLPNNRAMFWDFLDRNEVDRDKVEVVTVQFNGPHVVAANKADAADAVSWYELAIYQKLTGVWPDYMEFIDYGVPDGYFFIIITTPKVLEEKPDVARRFIKAVLEAEKWTLENPDEARNILTSNVEEVSDEFAKQSRGILDEIITDEDTARNGLGWQSPQVWETMVDWYLSQELIQTQLTASELFTNDYLPATPIMVSQ